MRLWRIPGWGVRAWRNLPTSSLLRGWSKTSGHEGVRAPLREQGVSFQRLKTFKDPNDSTSRPSKPACSSSTIADGHAEPVPDGHAEPGPRDDSTVVICLDEFGPLNSLARRAG